LVLEGEVAYVLLSTLGLPARQSVLGGWRDLSELLSALAGFPIRRKTSVFVGIRIGRPEKAMPRYMKPPVHLLFPVGMGGGPSRDLLHASEAVDVTVELLHRVCATCGVVSSTARCHLCGGPTTIQKTCPSCGRLVEGGLCPACRTEPAPYGRVRFPLKQALQVALRRVNHQPTPPLKGVQRLTNATRVAEPLEKGVLRAKHDLTIYKDGTVRFDATNVPLTHFRAHQIGTTAAKLRELGYTSDVKGDDLRTDDQLVELFVQDIVLPWEAGMHFVRTASFVDDLLVQVYGLEPNYNLRDPHDLVGHLVAGLAPHTSAAVVGRIIGFTTGQVCFAHPYWHSAKRRDCDGDQDSLLLLLDLFLNFSREFLPAQIGGLMDAPLLLQPIVLPQEVQRQAHNLDVSRQYSAEFYEATQRREGPAAWAERMDIIRHRLGSERELAGLGFTHPSTTLSAPRARSSYASVKSLPEKLQKQIDLARKIAAVDAHEVVAAVLRTHLLPDVLGNLRAYTAQRFRCKECGTRYRRVPLKGVCLNCDGALQPTVTRASVEKYLELGRRLCTEFEVGDYLRRRFELVAQELALLFPAQERSRQQSLGEFVDAS
jgi:DNA polymerase II large subunit